MAWDYSDVAVRPGDADLARAVIGEILATGRVKADWVDSERISLTISGTSTMSHERAAGLERWLRNAA